ncbi:hypothetical protein M413DRAFT_71471 [Hebeloma cylindrosporum]|uniref:Uncharacterized protein n=1 Tax=Hebeloma cylindrosporum TaxID=76867 RepID=A0A0C3BZF7_HEBCY|nr:hypothetical protein M413DRAFT_71471 [Hebeloma cylindrosporum h7]
MSTAILAPTLTQWTENHVTAIIQATNEQDLTSAIDAFLAKDATIVINGAKLSRAEFQKQLQTEKFDEAGATISFVGAVQVPADKDKPFDAGSVGLFYNALIVEAIRIRDAPVTSEITASLNVV